MHRPLVFTSLLLPLLLAGVSCSTSRPTVTCGAGTRLEGTSCVIGEAQLECGTGTHESAGRCIADPPADTISCGTGTVLSGTVCVPQNPLQCGEGTVAQNGSCVPTVVPGQYQAPLTYLSELPNVGSHSDEVKLGDNNLLLNCSYTFNVIDATTTTLKLLSPVGGLTHVIPGDTRKPGCKHLAPDGNLVFTTHFGNARNPAYLSGWDITNPKAPVQLPVLQEPGISYQGIDVSNHNIFVAMHENGLGVFQYSAATGFTRVGQVGDFTLAWGVAAKDNIVVVADAVGSVGVVDATDPTHPVLKGTVVTGGQPRGAVIDGTHAYVAAGESGLFVIDISNPASPTVVAQQDMPGTALRVSFSENRVFVAAWNTTRVYDVATPASPRFIAAIRVPREFAYPEDDRERPTHRTFGVAARGKDVFIGCWDHPFVYHLEDRLAPSIHLDESSVRTDFGPVDPGTSKTINFHVMNDGTAPLTLTESWMSNPMFSVEPRQARIEVGQSMQLKITFHSTGTDIQTSMLYLYSDDPAYPLRKAFLVANPVGLSIGSKLPVTNASMTDGSTWSSTDAEGSVLLLTYFGTFCPVCANHLPDTQERSYNKYGPKGLKVVALDSQESVDLMPDIISYVDRLQITFPTGVEDGAPTSAATYKAIVTNFEGPNPFPVDVLVDKKGIIRYATHEYDPDAMAAMIEDLLAEP